MLGVLALLLTTASSATTAASTPTVAAASLSAALTLCLRTVSICGICFRRFGRRSRSAIANLGLFHKSFFGCCSVARAVLRDTFRKLVGLTFKIGRTGVVIVGARHRVCSALTSARTIPIAAATRSATATRTIAPFTRRCAVG